MPGTILQSPTQVYRPRVDSTLASDQGKTCMFLVQKNGRNITVFKITPLHGRFEGNMSRYLPEYNPPSKNLCLHVGRHCNCQKKHLTSYFGFALPPGPGAWVRSIHHLHTFQIPGGNRVCDPSRPNTRRATEQAQEESKSPGCVHDMAIVCSMFWLHENTFSCNRFPL